LALVLRKGTICGLKDAIEFARSVAPLPARIWLFSMKSLDFHLWTTANLLWQLSVS
jgi:hypothetical protein